MAIQVNPPPQSKIPDKILNDKELRDYFVYQTPVWKERIKNCNGVIDHNKYELNFKNDDDHESFYESYNYEPDEQSKEVQDKSIIEIDVQKGKDWLNGISGKTKLNISVY